MYGKIFYSIFFLLLISLLAWQIDWRIALISPFTFWIVIVFVESFTHSRLILNKVDVTPEGMDWGRRLVVVSPRFILVGLLILIYGMPLVHAVVFTFGCLFIHLLMFGPLLNKLTGKDWDHLDNGYTDRFLNWITRGHFFARIFFLLLLASGCITLFYKL